MSNRCKTYRHKLSANTITYEFGKTMLYLRKLSHFFKTGCVIGQISRNAMVNS